jgi:hypothetical protein
MSWESCLDSPRDNFFLFKMFSPAVGPFELHIQLIRSAPSQWVQRPGSKTDHYLQLAPKLRMSGVIPPLPMHPHGEVRLPSGHSGRGAKLTITSN